MNKPIRTCLGCNRSKPQVDMVRIVYDNEGLFQIDLSRTSPGRGAYICMNPHCWKDGVDKSRLERAFRIDHVDTDSLRHIANFKVSVDNAI